MVSRAGRVVPEEQGSRIPGADGSLGHVDGAWSSWAGAGGEGRSALRPSPTGQLLPACQPHTAGAGRFSLTPVTILKSSFS